MKTRASVSSVSTATRAKQPNFLFGLLGREAETYADAYLVSDEGKRFPIVRSLLAMKCAFFKEKFFPGSVERESHSDVDLDGHDDFLGEIDSEGADDTQNSPVIPEDEIDATVEGVPATQADEPAVQENPEASNEAVEQQDAITTEPTDISGKEESTTEGQVQDAQEITAQDAEEAIVRTPVLPASPNGSFQANGNMKPRYPMPFPTILLKQVVEFIYTDSVKFLDDIEAAMKPWRGAADSAQSPCAPSCMVVSHIVELSRAADYVQLKELCLRCCFILRMVVKTKRSTACAALGAIRRQKDNPLFLNKMASHIVKYISGDVKKSFAVVPCTKHDVSSQEANSPCFGAYGLCTVMHLSSAALEEVICAQSHGFSDEYMLQVVYFWATGGKRLSSLHAAVGPMSSGGAKMLSGDDENEASYFDAERELSAIDLSTIASSRQVTHSSPTEKDIRPHGIPLVAPKMKGPDSENRFAEGKTMTERFILSDMNPSFLHEYLEVSGLVDRETFYNVYRFRALSGPRFSRMFSIRKRGCPPRCDEIGGAEDHTVT